MFFKYLLVFLVSIVPAIELRGAIPIGIGMGLAPIPNTVVCVLGNLLIIPIVFFTFEAFLHHVETKPSWQGFVGWVHRHAEKHKKQIVKDGEDTVVKRLPLTTFFALLLFVLVPCPGTGAWTGSIVAVLFGFPKKSAALAVSLGVCGCAVVMNLIMDGFLNFLQFLL